MVTRILLQMEGEDILALLKVAQLITPVTLGTGCLELLDAFVSPMDSGQGLSHLVKVSSIIHIYTHSSENAIAPFCLSVGMA